MTILPNGVAVCGQTHHALWCAEKGLVHEEGLPSVIRTHLNPGETFLDCGAHIGSLTRVALGLGAKVLAFEPNPEAFQCLRHNCPEAEAYQNSLSDKAGFEPFQIDTANAGASHVVSLSFQYSGIEVTFAEWKANRVLSVKIDSLELPTLHMLKLDCEGSELRVLKGAEQTINRLRPKLLIEVNKAALERQGTSRFDLFQWLALHDYGYTVLQELINESHAEQFDILAQHQGR